MLEHYGTRLKTYVNKEPGQLKVIRLTNRDGLVLEYKEKKERKFFFLKWQEWALLLKRYQEYVERMILRYHERKIY